MDKIRLIVIIESNMDYSHANSCLITCTLLLILSDWSLPIVYFFNISDVVSQYCLEDSFNSTYTIYAVLKKKYVSKYEKMDL